jgi:O-antigen/teichoic acid export membrane protein
MTPDGGGPAATELRPDTEGLVAAGPAPDGDGLAATGSTSDGNGLATAGSTPDRGGHSAAELTQATTRGLRWISVSRLATEVLLMGSMVVLAHLIRPAAFGEVAVALIFQELAMGIPAEGVGSALVVRREVTREHLQAGAALTLLVALALIGIVLLLSVFVVPAVFGPGTAGLVRLSTPLFLLASLSTVPVALLRRKLDFRRLAVIEIWSSVTRAVVSLALAGLLGLQGSALVLGGLAAGTVGTAIACASARAPLPRLRRKAVRDIAGYGLPASLAAICWTGFRNGDYAVLNAKLGAAAAGQYWRAYTLAVDYQSKIAVVMYTIAFPVLSRSASQADMFALRRRMVRLLTVVIFPLLAFLSITAPTLIPWLFGPAWEPAIRPTQILCAGGAVTVVINAAGIALMAEGRARALLGYGLGHFAVYVGTVVLVAHLGLTAVAIDAAIVHGLFLVVAYAILLRGSPQGAFRGLWGDVGAATISCAVMAAAMVPVDLGASAASLGPPLTLLSVGAVGAAAYLLALRVGFAESSADLSTLVRRLVPMDEIRLRVLRGRHKVRAMPADKTT